MPPFLFYPTYCSFLSSSRLPPCPPPIILLWLLTHINFLPHFDPYFLPSFIHLLSTSLSTIIISLYHSTHSVLRVHSIKTKTHLNSGGIATDTTAAYAHVCCGVVESCSLEDSTRSSSVNRHAGKLFPDRRCHVAIGTGGNKLCSKTGIFLLQRCYTSEGI